MAERPTAQYHSTQLELISCCRIGLGSYREHIPEFSNFKGFYDANWGNTFEDEINAAAILPDFQARDEASETAWIDLEKKGKECANKWQDLKRYIDSAWDDEYQKPKLEAAGSTLYLKASQNNWEIMKGLMETANEFITNNQAALTANQNMPNAFQGQFTTLKNDFTDLYDDFADKTQDTEEQTDAKINLTNAIYAKLIDMFEDGQAIFRADKALQNRFIFAQVLKMVRGSKGKTITVTIAANSKEFVDRVVKNSKIENIGGVDLLVDQGNLETPTSAAVPLPVGEGIDVPGGSKAITIFNQDSTTEGKCTVRVTVD